MSESPLRPYFKGIADVLREKKKTTEKISPKKFKDVIQSIPGGEYDITQDLYEDGSCDLHIRTNPSGGNPLPKLINKEIISNGKYNARDDNADGYSTIDVNIPKEDITLLKKNITINGTYIASEENVDGYSEVHVNILNAEPVLIDKSITQNGDYSAITDGVDGYSNVSVNIPDAMLITKSITENGEYLALNDNVDGYSGACIVNFD